MKAIELYKFVTENKIEYHWHGDDVMMFVDDDKISKFNNILPVSIFDDYGISCIMKYSYFCFEMKHICEYCDIELIDIFPNKEN
jgi:hypothetical protein